MTDDKELRVVLGALDSETTLEAARRMKAKGIWYHATGGVFVPVNTTEVTWIPTYTSSDAGSVGINRTVTS